MRVRMTRKFIVVSRGAQGAHDYSREQGAKGGCAIYTTYMGCVHPHPSGGKQVRWCAIDCAPTYLLTPRSGCGTIP